MWTSTRKLLASVLLDHLLNSIAVSKIIRNIPSNYFSDEEDVTIIPQPVETSPLQQFWKWVTKSSKTATKQKVDRWIDISIR